MSLTTENAESTKEVAEDLQAFLKRHAAFVPGADLSEAAKVRTMATPEKVAVFVDCLRGRGWLTARAIEAESGLGDRLLRALAEASDGEIISGQLGYRLTCEATLPELDAAEGWLRSQAKKMTARAVAIRVARNRRRDDYEAREGREVLTAENAESAKF